MKKILFVCSMALNRSATAEALFLDHECLSCGIEPDARVVVNQKLIDWADVIVCMEDCQCDFLKVLFNCHRKMIVLDIPDVYDYMDESLVWVLRRKFNRILCYN